MAKINIILNGAQGKMGLEIARLAKEDGRIQAVNELDLRSKNKFANTKPATNSVVIDFSSPEGLVEALEWSVKSGIPFISGTTGISAEQTKLLKVTSQKIPVLWAPNMSVGINMLINLINTMGAGLKRFNLQLEEFHHIDKKDAPSGTAKLLQSVLENNIEGKMPPVLSGRGGSIIGTHKLWLMGEGEVITFEHVATDRSIFARGSLEAAAWLSKQKKAKLYTMQDVLSGQ